MEKQHIVIFTGAGISAPSGMPTYRDEKGIWKDADLCSMMSVGGYYENPEKVLEVLNNMRLKCYNARPNNAHYRIAELEESCEVTVITQNVDDLHERAGSTRVLHVHGELCKVTSSNNRLNPNYICKYPLNIPISIGDKALDGSQLRPAVTLFGEYLTEFSTARDIVTNADIFIVIGTSLKVFPASRLINYAHDEIPKFIINPDKELDELKPGYTFINKDAIAGIEIFIDCLFNNLL